MVISWIKMLCTAVLVGGVFVGSSIAQEFKVGRATISFGSPGWIAAEVPDAGFSYSGEINGNIPSETRLFLNKSKTGQAMAVILVNATKGGIGDGYFHYSPVCEHKQAMLAEGNKGFQQSFSQCLMVFPPFTTSSLVNQLNEHEQVILKSSKVQLPEAMQWIYSHYFMENGTQVTLRAMLAPGFAGLRSATGQSGDPLFAWARELMKAVKAGASSFRGRLEIPPMEFKNDDADKTLVGFNPQSIRYQ